ncbi:MAG: hypothetical protein ABSD50_17640 [Smithella sp.]|jgi:hypothetical protein
MQKPIDLWLCLVGIVAGIIMWLIPKTALSITISLITIFFLLWHPVWKFWGIEKRLWRRIFAEVLLAILVFGLGYFVWPVKQEQIPPPTTNERPYFVIYGSPTIKTNPKFQLEINNINNIGKHAAINLYHRVIVIGKQFQGKPSISEFSSANEYPPNIPHFASVDMGFCENVDPFYIVFAIRYEDKEILSKKYYKIWYYKMNDEWKGAIKGTTPPPLVYASLEEKENIINHLKQELKDYLK